MKKVLLMTVFLILSKFSISQLLGNGSSETSVLYPNGSVSFSTAGGVLGAGYIKYADSSYRARNLIFGANILAKNNEGISKIFDAGSFTPEGKVNAILGYTFTCKNKKKEIDAKSENQRIKGLIESFLEFYPNCRDSVIDNLIKENYGSGDLAATISQEIKKTLDASNLSESVVALGVYHKTKRPNDQKLGEVISKMNQFIENKIKELNGLIEKDEASEAKVRTNMTYYKRLTLYSNFGMQASAFKQYQMRDTVNFSNNFTNQQFEGANFGIGVNYKLGGILLFGVSTGVRRWNNLDQLTSKDYTIKTTTTSGNSEFVTEKKVTGYSGTYGEFNQRYLNIDVVWFISNRMRNTSNSGTSVDVKNIFGINPYFSIKASNNKVIYPNVANIGLNIFVFKPNGKFSGGMFVELPDIKNNLEKMQDNPNLRDPITRLSFGLVGKLAIGSLFAPNF